MAAPFKIRLADTAAGITAQASERAFAWAGDRVQLELQNDGVKIADHPTGDVFEVPSGTSPQAAISLVYGARTSRAPYFWRVTAGGGGDVAAPGTVHTVEISNRLRLSVWAFIPPLTSDKMVGGKVAIDAGQVGLLKAAQVDDLSLVWTITWAKRDKPTDPAKPPTWHGGFVARGQTSETARVEYLRSLIGALHPEVQVQAGFEIVRATPKKEAAAARAKRIAAMTEDQKAAEAKRVANDAALAAVAADFAAWLLAATADDIKRYAQSINAFFESRGLDVDGIGFDFEFDGLNDSHAANLALLYRETSDAVAHHNGLVSYANAPFTVDGDNHNAFMRPQPYAIAATGHNLLARPMCFDGATSSAVPLIEASIACALRDPKDPKAKGGAGLHPSQLQMGIWTAMVKGGAEALCRTVLRPNRIGLLVYNLPASGDGATTLLKQLKVWNDALNPGEGPANMPGKPLQVPRGSGGWPPPFKPPAP